MDINEPKIEFLTEEQIKKNSDKKKELYVALLFNNKFKIILQFIFLFYLVLAIISNVPGSILEVVLFFSILLILIVLSKYISGDSEYVAILGLIISIIPIFFVIFVNNNEELAKATELSSLGSVAFINSFAKLAFIIESVAK